MRLHSETERPHHHVGILGVDIIIDDNDHFAGGIHAGGRMQRLLGLARMALFHAYDPPVPTAAHLWTRDFQHFGMAQL
jgi:hypothetical protein